MALSKLTTYLENIQALSDTPNSTEGLTADELKALFDKAPTDIKTYLNDTLTAEIDSLITTTKLALNPIGSIVMNITNTNPSTYIGGTWTAWGAGRVPVGVDTTQTEFDTVEEIGGSKYLQTHVHDIDNTGYGQGTAGDAIVYGNVEAKVANYMETAVPDGTTGNSGNLQPYITCYMWKRTA